MGHGGRSIALIERLTALGHRIAVFTFADAFRLLSKSGYQPHRIMGLQWGVHTDGTIAAMRTARNLCRFLRSRRESLDLIRQLALAELPDLFITDFEPLTALAADSLGVPCVSIDNQHKFCHPLDSSFPLRLRIYARLAGQFVQRWIYRPRQCIVAVFHACPPSPQYRRVDVLLRDRLARLQPNTGNHVLLYGRGELGARMALIASTVDAQFIAYGCHGTAADNITYKPTSYEEFARDLASCKAVLCTGGQQLIGEARYFGKPMLIVPIPKQHEQEINARFACRQGIGEFCSIDQLSAQCVQALLQRGSGDAHRANGVDQIIELLETANG